MTKYILILGLTLLAACQTQLPPNATCNERWSAYADDRLRGALIGGMAGASMSGTKPNC